MIQGVLRKVIYLLFSLFASTMLHVCSKANPTALPRKLKIAPTTFSTIAGNASTAFPENLFRESTNFWWR